MVSLSRLEESEQTFNGKKIYYKEVYNRRYRVIIKECEYCEENFTAFLKEVKKGYQSCCSIDCSNKNMTKGKTGEKHNSYKGKVDFVDKIKKEESCSNIDCSEADPSVLCFHHTSSEEKVGDVSRMAISGEYSLEDIKEEVRKCDILCHNCHRIHHSSQKDEVEEHKIEENKYYKTSETFKSEIIYGKKGNSRKYLLRDCEYCGQRFFARLDAVKSGGGKYHSYGCAGRSNSYSPKTKRGFVKIIKNYMQCSIEGCNESRDVCLDFHHTNKINKDDVVSEMLENGATLDELKQEIKKCSLICANCHQVEHTA